MRGNNTVSAPDTGGAPVTEPAGDAKPTPEQARKAAAARRHLVRSLVLELALPLAGYYVLLAVGLNQWAALTVGSLLALPWLVVGMVRKRRAEVMPLFTLSLLIVGALMSLITGDPRVLLIRDSWLFGALALWVLGSLATRRPFMLTASHSLVAAKIGEDGAREWAARWGHDAEFRHHLRVLTAVWGAGFALDAGIRVTFACTLPIGSVPLVNTLQWLVVLGGLLLFHTWYVTRHGLKV